MCPVRREDRKGTAKLRQRDEERMNRDAARKFSHTGRGNANFPAPRLAPCEIVCTSLWCSDNNATFSDNEHHSVAVTSRRTKVVQFELRIRCRLSARLLRIANLDRKVVEKFRGEIGKRARALDQTAPLPLCVAFHARSTPQRICRLLSTGVPQWRREKT